MKHTKEPFLKQDQKIKQDAVTILGIPFDEHSSFMQGPASAPARIREVLHSGATNLCSESGVDLAKEALFMDLGNLRFDQTRPPLEQIEQTIETLLMKGARVLSLGGDHVITYPIVKAYTKKYANLNILHLDAHPDLYDSFQGNRLSHACPFARIMEQGLVRRLVQMGIRTLNPHQRAQAKRFKTEIIEMKDGPQHTHLDFDGPVYLSVDVDVLDPAFAPGVSHHEPGGLSTRDLIQIIQNMHATIVGADIVEFNPRRDPVETTAMVCAKLLKEIGARMLETKER